MSNDPEHCDGGACESPAAVAETLSPPPVGGVAFRIHGMDCAEEVGILKRALADLVPEQSLTFDVLNGRMTARVPVAEQAVIEACEEESGFHFLYEDADSLKTKIETVVTTIYGAERVE